MKLHLLSVVSAVSAVSAQLPSSSSSSSSSSSASSACINAACTTHCDPNVTESCCEPLTCQYDPVFSDTRCIPKPPLICETGHNNKNNNNKSVAVPTTMKGFAADSREGASRSAKFSSSLAVPVVGSLHETFRDIPSNYSSCEVLVQVYASSVNPSDVTPSVGRDSDTAVALGSDMAGVVVQVSSSSTTPADSECKRLKVGDAVWGDIGANAFLSKSGEKTKELGGYAEYAVALESQLGLKPDNMSFVEAGALPKVALTSYKALVWFADALEWQGNNKTVLVLGGSGGTGTTGLQLARHFGAAEIITSCGADNFEYCKENGADKLIDYHTQNWWDVLDDDSVDIVYDTVGQEGTGNRAMDKLRTGGYFVTIATGLATKVKPGVHQANFINSDTNLNNIPEMDALTEIANSGALSMPRIFATYGLEGVADAFELSRQGKTVGKISISVHNATAAAV